jgi:hypothetical protein
MNRQIDPVAAVIRPVATAAEKASAGRAHVEGPVFHTALLPLLGSLLTVLGFTIILAGMMAMVLTPIPARVARAHTITGANLDPTVLGWDAPRVANVTNSCADGTQAIPLCQEIASAPGLPQIIAASQMTIEPASGDGRTLAILATTPPPDLHAEIFAAMARAHFASPEMRDTADPTASAPSDLRADLAAMAESRRPIGLPVPRGTLANCHLALGCSGPSTPWRPEQQSGVATSTRAEAASSERRP